MDLLDAAQLCEVLKKKGLKSDTAHRLRDEDIDGALFSSVTNDFLRSLGFKGAQMLAIMQLRDLLCGSDTAPSALPAAAANQAAGVVVSEEESHSEEEDVEQLNAIRQSLAPYLSASALDEASGYDLRSMHSSLRRWESAVETGLPGADKIKPNWMVEKESQKQKPNSGKRKQAPVNESSRGQVVASNRVLRHKRPKPVTPAIENDAEKENVSPEDTGSSQPGMEGVHPGVPRPEDPSLELEVQPFEEISHEPQLFSEEQRQDMIERISVKDPELPVYDIADILSKKLFFKDEKQKLKVLEDLKRGKIIDKTSRKRVIRSLTKWLYFNHVSNVRSVSTSMREGLAKSFTVHYPQYAVMDAKVPWSALYDRTTNTGWIGNAARPILQDNRQRQSKKNGGADEGNTEASEDDIELDAAGILKLSLLMPDRHQIGEITNGMRLSFKKREEERRAGQSITFFLEKYPHFKSYGGELIQQEFRRINPEAQDMCLMFMNLKTKFLALPSARVVQLKFKNDILKALVLLSQQFPHDVPLRGESCTDTWAKEADVVVVLHTNDDVEEFIVKKRLALGRPVQPYLIVVKSQLSDQIVRVFLVLDGSSCQLNTTNFLQAVDILLKAYFIFNVRHPLGWRNTFHFLQVYLYKVFERSYGNSRPDKATSSDTELWLKLQQM